MNKKAIYSLAVVIIVIVAGLGIYFEATHLAKKGKTSIVFAAAVSSGEEYTFDQSMVSAFNSQHSNVSVKFESLNNFYPTLGTEFSTNSAPGVFYMENSALPEFASQGYLQNLKPVLSGNSSYNLSGFAPTILKTFSYKSGLYAAPKDWSPLEVFYNKAIFNAENVKYPGNGTWNWTTMKQTLQMLKANESQASSLGIKHITPMVMGPQVARALAFMHEAGGDWINEKGNGAVNNTTAFRQGFSYWYNLYSSGLASLNSNYSAGWNGGDFAAGNVGMIVSGTWTVPVLNASGAYFAGNMSKVGYYYMPSGPTGIHATMMFNVGLGVNSGLVGSQKWIADQFVQFFTGPKGEKQWVSKGLALPSRTAILESSWYSSHFPIQSFVGKQFPYAYGWNYNTTNFEATELDVHNVYASLFSGSISLHKSLTEMLDVTNASLAGTSTL
ncbi:MAG: ABC transporter substrate-binding protein [Candidatus Thermoplasmatota archaeon]|nr:ABC transporter substrate-binding protein [Candidatus Thermoplasmatota archaeon]